MTADKNQWLGSAVRDSLRTMRDVVIGYLDLFRTDILRARPAHLGILGPRARVTF